MAWCSLAPAQRPSDADAAPIIERARQRARQYAQSLPDFDCTEVVRRHEERNTPDGVQSVLSDKLTIRTRYFEHKEEQKLILIDDRPTDRTLESLQGVVSTGEFGATLSAIFDPASETAFYWESWKTVRRHRVGVFSYVVDVAHSRYNLRTAVARVGHKAIVGYHGVLEVDVETGEVLHFTYVADRIPKEMALQSTSTTVDYDFADIGGRDYLLPVRSETQMYTSESSVTNKMEFTLYRKFSADSVIDFGPGK